MLLPRQQGKCLPLSTFVALYFYRYVSEQFVKQIKKVKIKQFNQLKHVLIFFMGFFDTSDLFLVVLRDICLGIFFIFHLESVRF